MFLKNILSKPITLEKWENSDTKDIDANRRKLGSLFGRKSLLKSLHVLDSKDSSMEESLMPITELNKNRCGQCGDTVPKFDMNLKSHLKSKNEDKFKIKNYNPLDSVDLSKGYSFVPSKI